MNWSCFVLKGNQVINDASDTLDREIVNYLKQKKAFASLKSLTKIIVPDSWPKATEPSVDAATEHYAADLDEIIHRGNTMTEYIQMR